VLKIPGFKGIHIVLSQMSKKKPHSTYVQKYVPAGWVLHLIDIRVGISGDQLLGLTILLIILTGAGNHHVLVNALPALLLFNNDDTHGSCKIGHYLICSTLLDSTWTRLLLNSVQNTEDQETGLHSPLTLRMQIFGCGDTQRLHKSMT
jgi:hypothetical protein